MADINKKFVRLLPGFSPEVQFFHSTNVSSLLVSELAKKYSLKESSILEYMMEATVADFDFSLLEKIEIPAEEKDSFILDFIGYLFLPIDPYIKKDVKGELVRRGANPDGYIKHIIYFNNNLEEAHLNNLEKFIEEYQKNFDVDGEKEYVNSLFNDNIDDLLLESKDLVSGVDGTILFLLFNDKNYKEELLKSLYKNPFLLTHAEFILDGKPHSPTIGNWIQDFIKTVGTQYVNNLAITKYITDSENAKKLTPEEKKLVQKLIQLYRNLKFFPDSLKDLPPEKWEIIPVDRQTEEKRKEIGLPKTEEEKEIDSLKEEEAKYNEGGLERLVLEEEINYKKKIEDLKIEQKKYQEGSLEWRALEEEIGKLTK